MFEGLLKSPPQFLFFTGKGGVGKTSTAAATAIALADRGERVLLVSTDPASNLDEVLGITLTSSPKEVPSVPLLDAMNIDPMASAAAYKERVVGAYRGVLPESTVASIEEQLSGACTVEIAAFDEFTNLLTGHEVAETYGHVIFDTAPTGHTLRLLSLPNAWADFMESSTLQTSCIGPLSGLSEQYEHYKSAVKTLADRTKTILVLVSRPSKLSLDEAARAGKELANLGINNQYLILNGIFKATDREDRLAVALEEKTIAALESLPPELADLERDEVPLLAWSPVGIDSLRSFLNLLPPPNSSQIKKVSLGETEGLMSIVDKLAERGRGLILTMGKGGVGKTTLAAAIAIQLADRGYRVELTTTDPAAHLDAVTFGESYDAGKLLINRIDPEEETAVYSAEVLADAGRDMEEAALAVLEEDLRSPCTAEIAVIRAFSRVVGEAENHFVVLDTAPTGHTLLLIEAARSFHSEAGRQSGTIPKDVELLIDRLTDPDFTSVFVVTIPEATPIHEAAALQDDLRRAGIEPEAWIINQSLAMAEVTDPVLTAKAIEETNYIAEIAERYTPDMVVVAMSPNLLVGSKGLSAIFS